MRPLEESNRSTNLYYKKMNSPVGELKLIASEDALVAVLWEQDNPLRVRLRKAAPSNSHPILNRAEQELNRYFAGRLTKFSVPIDLRGTQFQVQVWEALLAIPFGQTRTYGELAKQLGNPQASRAVGAANGKNPISIIVPCHRVIGSTGKLTGFAGGLENKAQLLELERRTTRH